MIGRWPFESAWPMALEMKKADGLVHVCVADGLEIKYTMYAENAINFFGVE